MENVTAKPLQPTDDNFESVELDGDAALEELILQGGTNLLSRIVNGFRRVPETGRVLLSWQTKGKGNNCHVTVTAKTETINHAGAIVRKKKPA